MSIEEEARRQLEAQRRANQDRHAQYEASSRAFHIEQDRAKSEAMAKAISRFNRLNPEGILEEVRRAWHVGRILRHTDPLYLEVGHGMYGVMLYHQGETKHSKDSTRGGYGYLSAGGDGQYNGMTQGKPVWKPGGTSETDKYDVNIAEICLRNAGDGYQVVVADLSGWYQSTKTITKTGLFGLFGNEESIQKGYNFFYGWDHPSWFNMDSVRPEDIRAFFVHNTARRMSGEGNLRIR